MRKNSADDDLRKKRGREKKGKRLFLMKENYKVQRKLKFIIYRR
jgi:hypothetical protein